MSFSVGDRVRVFCGTHYTGIVKEVGYDKKLLLILMDPSAPYLQMYVQPKQCRKLKSKVKREPAKIWVNMYCNTSVWCSYSSEKAAIVSGDNDKSARIAVPFVECE